MSHARSLADALARLDGRERWTSTGTVDVDGDVGHPQGLLPWGNGWLVTTVHLDPVRGEALLIDRDGAIVDIVEVTDGPRIHPGGAARHDDGCIVAVAEYRPDSTTLLRHIDASAAVTDLGRVDDHLGAVCTLDDGTLFAVSWGSRRLYRLDADGRILDQRDNPSHFVDFQDVTPAGPGVVAATGVGTISAPAGPVQLGGMALIQVDELTVSHTAPVQAWMPSGRVATYNGAHLEGAPASAEGVSSIRLHCIVDDGDAAIATWTTAVPS